MNMESKGDSMDLVKLKKFIIEESEEIKKTWNPFGGVYTGDPAVFKKIGFSDFNAGRLDVLLTIKKMLEEKD